MADHGYRRVARVQIYSKSFRVCGIGSRTSAADDSADRQTCSYLRTCSISLCLAAFTNRYHSHDPVVPVSVSPKPFSGKNARERAFFDDGKFCIRYLREELSKYHRCAVLFDVSRCRDPLRPLLRSVFSPFSMTSRGITRRLSADVILKRSIPLRG